MENEIKQTYTDSTGRYRIVRWSDNSVTITRFPCARDVLCRKFSTEFAAQLYFDAQQESIEIEGVML